MKKTRILTACLTAVMLTAAAQPVLAELPKIQYTTSESVDVKWLKKAPNGVIPPGTVSFNVDFNSKSNGTAKYKVVCVLDDKTVINDTVNIPPATTQAKTFSFSADAGIHSVSVSIYKNGTVLYEKSENLYLVKPYEEQSMDVISGRGVNTHYGNGEAGCLWKDYKYVNDAMYYAGLLLPRLGGGWEYNEKKKGVFDFSYIDGYYEYFPSHRMTPYWCSGYGNGWWLSPMKGITVNDGWYKHTRVGYPQNEESLRGYVNDKIEATKEHMKRGLTPYYLEGWNEINDGSVGSHMMAQIYNDITQPIKMQHILQELDEEADICGITPQTVDEKVFLNEIMVQGFYPYFDYYAAHTYQFKDGFEVSDMYSTRLEAEDDYLTKWGGWKAIQETETGFTTPKGTNSRSTLESANEEISKLYTICEYNNINQVMIYDLINDGTDEYYTEHNFGQINYDGSPKPQYLAVTNYNNQTSGGKMVGEIDTGLEAGTRAFLYWKDGKPVVIAWSNLANGGEVTWNIPGESVQVYDNYGNEIARGTNSITFGREPIYIHGLSSDWARKAVLNDVKKLNAEWIEDMENGLSSSTLSAVKDTFTTAEKDLSKEISAEDVLAVIDSYKKAGNVILADGKNGALEEVEVSKRLYRLYRIAEKISRLYMTEYEGETPKISERYDAMYKKARELYLNETGVMQYSDAMRKFAKEYHYNCLKVKDDKGANLPGYIAMSNMLVDFIADWFDEFTQYETITSMGLRILTPYCDRYSYADSDVETDLYLSNWTKTDFEGTICVFNEDGNKVCETPALKVKANGGSAQTTLAFNTKRPKEGNVRYYYISYVDKDGNVLKTQPTPYEIQDRFEISSMACTETPEELSKISFKTKNLSDKPTTVNLKFETDGSFTFKNVETQITLEGSEEKVFDVPVVSVDNNKYHFHTYKYTATDENGNVIASASEALSFPFVVKTEEPISVADFDGDISSWEDAYPIYFSVPENITEADAWQGSDCAGRAFFKWDEGHLYMLVDVYDEAYLQPFTGTNMWQGDCIQFSLDGDNCKGTNYSQGDYEIGFAHTPLGMESYTWYAPKDIPMGTVDWFKMIRNDELHFSRYLVAMDKSVLPTATFAEGSKYGMNIGVNDNDYLMREGWYQFTNGTVDSKNPSLYADFTFIKASDKTLSDGFANNIFPVNVESKINDTKAEKYNDIAGHWAEATIKSMSQLGFVSGMGDGSFNPDGNITRAEFFSLLKRVRNLSDGTEGFADTPAESWYYNAVTSVKELIPPEMLGDNNEVYPKKDITREEAVYLISACTRYNNDIDADCKTYPDGAEISDWAETAVNKALALGLIQGSDDGKLNPKSNLTRAEATIMFRNLITAY